MDGSSIDALIPDELNITSRVNFPCAVFSQRTTREPGPCQQSYIIKPGVRASLAINMSLPSRKHAASATVDKLVTHGSMVVKMLREISEATNSSYLKPIAGISMLIFDTIQVSSTGVVPYPLFTNMLSRRRSK